MFTDIGVGVAYDVGSGEYVSNLERYDTGTQKADFHLTIPQ